MYIHKAIHHTIKSDRLAYLNSQKKLTIDSSQNLPQQNRE